MCSKNRDKDAAELADIFRAHIGSYRAQLSAAQWKAVNAICMYRNFKDLEVDFRNHFSVSVFTVMPCFLVRVV